MPTGVVMVKETIWFVKIFMRDGKFIAYGSNKDMLPVYEISLGGKAHKKTKMHYPSMLKFISGDDITSMSLPVHKSKEFIEKNYGESYINVIPKNILMG